MLKDKMIILRSVTTGVFVGIAKEINDGSVWLADSRQIMKWECEPSLAHIAADGFVMPETVRMSPVTGLRKIENVCDIAEIEEGRIRSFYDIATWDGGGECFNNDFGYGITLK